MNAIGIVPNAASAGSTGGPASGASTGLPAGTSSANGFAGMLFQVIGGTQSGSAQTAPQSLPVGLLGLIGMAGQTSSENNLTDLMALLNGLTEQLNKLDANAELPTELQDQLAALLLVFQSILQTPDMILQQNGQAGKSNLEAVDAGSLKMQQQVPASLQTILQTLGQAVQQLTERLSQGGAVPVQLSALAEPIRQALHALRQTTEKQQKSVGSSLGSSQKGMEAANADNGPVPVNKALSSHEQMPAGMKAQSVIHKSSVPLRNPIWAFQAATTPDAGQTTSSQAAVSPLEATESGSQSQTAPVWTMLKGDTSFLPAGLQSSTPASAQVPVQQFAEQMGKFLVKQFVMTQSNGVSEAKISLHPEHLGQVDIKIMIQNGLLTAKFITENGAARDMLETQMSQLRTALQGQGLQVEKMEVVQQSAASAASFFQQQQRQQGSGSQEYGTGNRRSGELYDDAVEFELELERTTYLREIGFGSSLNVTA